MSAVCSSVWLAETGVILVFARMQLDNFWLFSTVDALHVMINLLEDKGSQP